MPAECNKKYVFPSLEIASYFCVHNDKILKVETHQEKLFCTPISCHFNRQDSVKKMETILECLSRFITRTPLEKQMATHPSILDWRIPWTEEPGGL